jgi:hypothetical protein
VTIVVTLRLNEQGKITVFKGDEKKSYRPVFFYLAIFLINCKMGSSQSSTASWSIDDWAYGTGENAATLDDVIHETSKIPGKYFGGNAIQNDASMHQMQHDLLSFDATLKNLFRRKKNKRSKRNQPPSDEDYYYYDEQQQQQQSEEIPQPTDSEQNQNYLQSIYTEPNRLPPLDAIYDSVNVTEKPSGKVIWRCSNCTVENKITERVCRRCGQSETRL